MFLCFFGSPRVLPSGLLIFSSACLLWWTLFTPLFKKNLPLSFFCMSYKVPVVVLASFRFWAMSSSWGPPSVPRDCMQAFGHIGSPCVGFKHVSHPTQVPRQQVLHTSSPLESASNMLPTSKYPELQVLHIGTPPLASCKHASYPSTSCTRASAH